MGLCTHSRIRMSRNRWVVAADQPHQVLMAVLCPTVDPSQPAVEHPEQTGHQPGHRDQYRYHGSPFDHHHAFLSRGYPTDNYAYMS